MNLKKKAKMLQLLQLFNFRNGIEVNVTVTDIFHNLKILFWIFKSISSFLFLTNE